MARFKALDERLDVAYDDYLRTTSERHKACCRELWRRCAKKGDVFLERYDGWYDERAEQFVKASDAKLQNYKDADGIPLKRTTEECYFFRLGKYAPAVREHIEANPDFVQPEARRKDVLKMLDDAEEIEKLSISRTTFDWGVGLPEGFDEGTRAWAASVLQHGVSTGAAVGARDRPRRRDTRAPRAVTRADGVEALVAQWGATRVDRERGRGARVDDVRQRPRGRRVDREPRVDGVGHADEKTAKNYNAGHVNLDRRADELCDRCGRSGRA